MFGFAVRRKRTPAVAGPRRARLVLEALESRYCPAAPQLSLAATVLSGHQVQLTGQVMDDDPGGVQITVGGVMMGTIIPASSGDYSYTACAASLGTVTAVARDSTGLTSDTAQVTLTSAVPVIQGLTATQGAGQSVWLSGTVQNETLAGLPVAFSGSAGGTATTASDGSFYVQVQAGSLGTIQATVTDPWGQTSAPAQTTLTNSRPVLTSFQAVHSLGSTYIFQGRVTDEQAGNLTVRLGGLPSLMGLTVTTASDGSFFRNVTLAPGEQGNATADVTDPWGAAAVQAWAAVSNVA
jgi:hypothetical protein